MEEVENKSLPKPLGIGGKNQTSKTTPKCNSKLCAKGRAMAQVTPAWCPLGSWSLCYPLGCPRVKAVWGCLWDLALHGCGGHQHCSIPAVKQSHTVMGEDQGGGSVVSMPACSKTLSLLHPTPRGEVLG